MDSRFEFHSRSLLNEGRLIFHESRLRGLLQNCVDQAPEGARQPRFGEFLGPQA